MAAAMRSLNDYRVTLIADVNLRGSIDIADAPSGEEAGRLAKAQPDKVLWNSYGYPHFTETITVEEIRILD